jgi:hypothetical protein
MFGAGDLDATPPDGAAAVEVTGHDAASMSASQRRNWTVSKVQRPNSLAEPGICGARC